MDQRNVILKEIIEIPQSKKKVNNDDDNCNLK